MNKYKQLASLRADTQVTALHMAELKRRCHDVGVQVDELRLEEAAKTIRVISGKVAQALLDERASIDNEPEIKGVHGALSVSECGECHEAAPAGVSPGGTTDA